MAEWISSSTAGADEGDAEQVAVVLVDEHAGAAGAAVGVQAGPSTAWPGSTSITRMRKAWRRWWATLWVLMYMRAAT